MKNLTHRSTAHSFPNDLLPASTANTYKFNETRYRATDYDGEHVPSIRRVETIYCNQPKNISFFLSEFMRRFVSSSISVPFEDDEFDGVEYIFVDVLPSFKFNAMGSCEAGGIISYKFSAPECIPSPSCKSAS